MVSDRVFALRDGKWAQLPSLRQPRAAGAAAVVGDRIVVIGGQTTAAWSTPRRCSTASSGARRRDIPTPREHLAAASDGDYVYAVGGRALSPDKNSAALERYDPAADRWQRLPDMPTARGGLGAAIAGGHLFAVGGESPTARWASRVLRHRAPGLVDAPLHAHPRHGLAVSRDRQRALRARRGDASRPRQRRGRRGGHQAHALTRYRPFRRFVPDARG